jgi:hypothetical protein
MWMFKIERLISHRGLQAKRTSAGVGLSRYPSSDASPRAWCLLALVDGPFKGSHAMKVPASMKLFAGIARACGKAQLKRISKWRALTRSQDTDGDCLFNALLAPR